VGQLTPRGLAIGRTVAVAFAAVTAATAATAAAAVPPWGWPSLSILPPIIARPVV